MKGKKEIKIGVTMVVAVALLIVGVNFMADKSWFSDQRILFAKYKRVDGLAAGNQVVLNGFKVGSVKDIAMDGTGKLVVKFVIHDKNLRIPRGTNAKIKGLGLMESKAIDLMFPELLTLEDSLSIEEISMPSISGEQDSAQDTGADMNLSIKESAYLGRYHISGDTLNSEIAKSLSDDVNDLVVPLKLKAENLIQSIDSVMVVVTAVLDKNARESLSESFVTIKRALHNLEKASINVDSMVYENRFQMKGIVDDTRYLTSSLKGNSGELSATIRNFRAISDSIADADITQTINNANDAFTEMTIMMNNINKGEGTLGKLLKDSVLYGNLEKASLDLDLLFKDMKDHPNRYVQVSVFGKKDKGQKKKVKEESRRSKKK
ncbi:MAG: MCE family protein [Flavobacteriales bacterium]|nr:MCE family protein [Flavobacteriales bacterium]